MCRDDIISKLTRGTHWVVELVSYNLQTWLYKYCFENKLKKLWKKFLTNEKHFDRINKLSQDRELKTEFKKTKKFLTNEQRFDRIIKLSQESKTKNIDNWTVRNLERFWESIRTLQWKLKTFKTVNSEFVRKRWKQSACRIVWGATDSCKFICNLNERISQV